MAKARAGPAPSLAAYALTRGATAQPPITIVVTGAAGQISYSLLPSLASGSVFGLDQPVRNFAPWHSASR